jgi:hypothetical protein
MDVVTRGLGDGKRSGIRHAMKRFSIRTILTITAIVAALLSLASFPVDAAVDFPMDQRSHVTHFFESNRISGELNRFSFNYVSTFNSKPGWSVWLSEKTILAEAQSQGYFCMIEYHSILGNSWKRSVDGKCGHHRLYVQCADCQSVSRPN